MRSTCLLKLFGVVIFTSLSLLIGWLPGPKTAHAGERTGREGTLKWKFNTESYSCSLPVVGPDGSVYVTTRSTSGPDGLLALSSDGTPKWKFQRAHLSAYSPVVAPDGTIYAVSAFLYALNPSGRLKWEWELNGTEFVICSPVVGRDGTIYVATDDYDSCRIYAINDNGTAKWKLDTGKVKYSSLAIGPDGTIYASSEGLYAISAEGKLRWHFPSPAEEGTVFGNLAIGADGTIYVGSRTISSGKTQYFHAINPDGSLKWQLGMDRSFSSPVIGPDETIYFGSAQNYHSTRNFFTAMNPDGTLKWEIETDYGMSTFYAIGADGVFYAVLGMCLQAINPGGSLRWRYEHGGSLIDLPVVMALDGTIYVTSAACIYALNSSAEGPARSSWPMFQHDQGHTGAADVSRGAFFYATPTSGSAPLTVRFKDKSVGEIRSWLWDFGDGSTSTRRNPSHTYLKAGRYTVGLTVTGSPGEDVETKKRFILVDVPGTLKWKLKEGSDYSGLSNPAIGADGFLYVVNGDGYLCAISPEGAVRWKSKIHCSGSPAIGSDGTIYVGPCAVNPYGTLKWQFTIPRGTFQTPAIFSDGTLYGTSSDHGLYAINPHGRLEWRFEADSPLYRPPVIGSDGTVYFAGSDDKCLYAVNPDGTLKWKITTGSSIYNPAIDADGTIYVGAAYGHIYAINPDGTLKWDFLTDSTAHVFSPPSIGPDGTIYAGSWFSVYALNPDGSLKWKFRTGGQVHASPAIGADGTIHVGASNRFVYAINPDGSLKWKYETGDYIYTHPLIGPDGTIYVGTGNSYLYALIGSSDGPADSPWPMFLHDQRHTGMVDRAFGRAQPTEIGCPGRMPLFGLASPSHGEIGGQDPANRNGQKNRVGNE